MRYVIAVAAAAVLLVGCGKDTVNNTISTNNTSTNNTSTNNTSTNNTTTNNTSTNNTSTNNTTNTLGPDPVSLACDGGEPLTPRGVLDDLVGLWYGFGMCLGESQFGPIYQLCEGAVVSSYEYIGEGGYAFVSADHQFIQAQSLNSEFEVWFPGECVQQILAGDCPSVEDRLIEVIPDDEGDRTLSCMPQEGGCLCGVTGQEHVYGAGTLTSDADGTLTLSRFDAAGAVESEEWQFDAPGGSDFIMRSAGGEQLVYTTIDDPATLALYCAGFMSNCNELVGQEGYYDFSDCFTRAGMLTRAGDPQTTGDSLECRFHHMLLSADTSDTTNRATHCPHAQLTPTEICVN